MSSNSAGGYSRGGGPATGCIIGAGNWTEELELGREGGTAGKSGTRRGCGGGPVPRSATAARRIRELKHIPTDALAAPLSPHRWDSDTTKDI